MKYPPEVIEAVRVLLDKLDIDTRAEMRLPADLMMEALTESKKDATPKELMDLWNKLADDRLPRCRALTDTRRKHAQARLRQFPKLQDWKDFLNALNHNPWALGEVPNAAYPGWKADFDYFIKPASIVRFFEKGMAQGATRPAQEKPRDDYRSELDRR